MHYIILIANGFLLLAHVVLWVIEWLMMGGGRSPPRS